MDITHYSNRKPEVKASEKYSAGVRQEPEVKAGEKYSVSGLGKPTGGRLVGKKTKGVGV